MNKLLIKSKEQMYLVIAAFTLIVLIGGTTYAFFNYTRTGSSNTVRTGTINFSSSQTNNSVSITNLFPISASDIDNPSYSGSVGEVEITVTGDTTYSGGIEYKLSIVNPVVTATANSETVTLPLSYVVTTESITTGEEPNTVTTNLGTVSNDYFGSTTRSSAVSPIYSILGGATPELVEAKDIFVGYIPANTSVNGKVIVKAFIDSSKILITDTATTDEPEEGYTNGTVVPEGVTRVTTSQWNSLSSSGLSFQVRVESNEGIWVENPNTLYNAVKAMSRGTMNAGTDFGTVASSDTTNHPYGVYQLVESNLTNPIYFFRGDHTVNNNVIFDNKCWLVVRTTETNSVRMLYNGTPVSGECTTTTGNTTMISLYQSDSVNSDGNYDYSYTSNEGFTTLISGYNFPFNVNNNNAKYVGYTYDNGVNSNMKNALEAWYDGAISSEAKAKIETSTYCNDTTVDETFTQYTKYMPHTRVAANTPSVICPTGANEISSKVGFLTVDEEILAGRTWSTGMQDYLYNNSVWWLGSPGGFDGGSAIEFVVRDAYSAHSANFVNGGNGLRPVVSITSNTAITGGDGSQGRPWIIG